MNNEGQNVVSGAPQTPPAASPVPPAQSPMPTPTGTNNQDDYIVISDPSAAAKNSKKKKLLIIIASILAAILLATGAIILIINLASIENSNKSGGNISGNESVEDIQNKMQEIYEADVNEEALENDDEYTPPKDDAEGLISYMDEFDSAFSNNDIDLSKEAAAEVYRQAAANLINYDYQYQSEKGKYNDKIIEYYYKIEDLLQSADSAAGVYWAEHIYGSEENAQKYRKIAIERGSNLFNENEEGEG